MKKGQVKSITQNRLKAWRTTLTIRQNAERLKVSMAIAYGMVKMHNLKYKAGIVGHPKKV